MREKEMKTPWGRVIEGGEARGWIKERGMQGEREGGR